MEDIKKAIEEALIQIFASEGDTGFRYMFKPDELFTLLELVAKDALLSGVDLDMEILAEEGKYTDNEIFNPYWQQTLKKLKE